VGVLPLDNCLLPYQQDLSDSIALPCDQGDAPLLSSRDVESNPQSTEIRRKKRYIEAQIIGFLREAEAGMTVKDVCRKHGFSEAS
jgi:putative transposase